MIDSSRCPPEQVVVDYAAGRLSDDDVKQFEEHLGECLACMEATEWIRFHFFANETDVEESAVVETQSLPTNQDEDPSVTPQIDADRFDMNLLAPAANPCALGRLGNYDVLQLIGCGGMGVVFKAYDDRLQRTVAIKALNRSLACSSTARRRFVREGRAAAAINHPNVVIIYHVEDHQDQPFLVMEYVGGGTLRDRLRKSGRLEPMPTLRISAQIAGALHAAHRQGIVHRDVKPANIMLEDGLERVKIADFGLARVSIDNVELTTGEMAVGTPAYMSPEQVRGEKIDSRSDLFALGCVMYAMLVGHSPFHGKSSLEMARRVLDDDPVPPDEAADNPPGFLCEIVMRLLEKDPERRYQSAGEVAEILNSHLAVLNQTPTDELNAVLHGRRLKRKRFSGIGVAAAIVAVLVVLGSVAAWSQGLIPFQRQDSRIAPSDSASKRNLPVGSATGGASELEKSIAPTKITVAKNIAADYSSLQEALEHAGSGTTIEILDSETYEEIVHIDRAEQWSGVNLVGRAERPATITSEYQAIVNVKNTPDVAIRHLRLKAKSAKQHVLLVGGKVPGLVLDHVEFITELENEWALVLFAERAAGSAEKPIHIKNCQFSAHNMAVVVNGDASLPVAHLHITDNQFRRARTHLQFNRCVQAVRVSGNVFQSGIGIALGLGSHQKCNRLHMTNNTFYQCDPWLDLRSSPPEVKGIVIANNLILEPGSHTRTERFSLAEYSANWSFRGNYCERSPSQLESGPQQIMTLQSEIAVQSRDANNAEQFLRLPADSPLARAGAGDDLPSYVGAIAPKEK